MSYALWTAKVMLFFEIRKTNDLFSHRVKRIFFSKKSKVDGAISTFLNIYIYIRCRYRGGA